MHQIRQNARPTSTLVGRAHRSSIASLVDRLAVRPSDEHARRLRLSIAPLDRRSHNVISSIAIVHRATRRHGAIVGRAAWSSIAPLVGAAQLDLGSLSLIWALSSLSFSFSGSDLKWKWGEKMISGSKMKILVNRKSFSGKWYFPWQLNTPVLQKMISRNSFHPIQTHPKFDWFFFFLQNIFPFLSRTSIYVIYNFLCKKAKFSCSGLEDETSLLLLQALLT